MTAHSFRVAFIALLLSLSAAASAYLRPSPKTPLEAPNIEALLPERFGAWREVAVSQAVLPAEIALTPGEAIAYRAYSDDLGRIVTLVAAYGPPLGDSVRLHRPENCYASQGYEILARGQSEIETAGRTIPIVNLDTKSSSRREFVTYWLRDGGEFTASSSDSGWRRLLKRAGPGDGALIRISTVNSTAPQFDLHRQFLEEFGDALEPRAVSILLGRKGGA